MSWFFALSNQNKKKYSLPKLVSRLMYDFKLSPLSVYGGEFKIIGMIGEQPVDLVVSVPAMNTEVFRDLTGFLKDKADAEKKAQEKSKQKRR